MAASRWTSLLLISPGNGKSCRIEYGTVGSKPGTINIGCAIPFIFPDEQIIRAVKSNRWISLPLAGRYVYQMGVNEKSLLTKHVSIRTRSRAFCLPVTTYTHTNQTPYDKNEISHVNNVTPPRTGMLLHEREKCVKSCMFSLRTLTKAICT